MSIDVTTNINPFIVLKLPRTMTVKKKPIRACSNPQCLHEPSNKDGTVSYCPLCGNKVIETLHDTDVTEVFDISDFVEDLFDDPDAFVLNMIERNNSFEEWIITPNSYSDGCFDKIDEYTTGFIDFHQYDYDMMIDRYFNRTKKWKTLVDALTEKKLEFQKSFGLVQRVS